MRLNQKLTKRIVAVAVVSAVAFLIIANTFAWFTSKDSVVNQFKAQDQHFSVKLYDKFSQPPSVEPDTDYDKIVSAKNYDTMPGFVRIMIFPTAIKDGMPLQVQFGTDVVANDLNTTDWKDGGDGYFYYLHVLQPGETANPLFTSVKLVSTELTGADFNIQVTSGAVQLGQYNYRVAWWNTNSPPVSAQLLAVDTILAPWAKKNKKNKGI